MRRVWMMGGGSGVFAWGRENNSRRLTLQATHRATPSFSDGLAMQGGPMVVPFSMSFWTKGGSGRNLEALVGLRFDWHWLCDVYGSVAAHGSHAMV